MNKFENGARVVFFGDSITANGTWMRRILEYYRKNTDIRFEMYNAGVPGDCAINGYSRIYDTVLSYDPTDVVIMFGMNDVGRTYYTEGASSETVIQRRAALDLSYTKIKQIVSMLTSRGIRVILLSPTPYDELSEIEAPCYVGVEAALYELGDRVSVFAKNEGIPFLGFNAKMFSILKQEYKVGKSFIGPDRVHPTAAGHELMASLFLEAQGFDVNVPVTVEEMTALAQRPYDEWENERYRLERRVISPMYIDRCRFAGIKDSADVIKYADELVFAGTTDYIKSCAVAYKDFSKNKDAFFAELIAHTKTVYEN